MDMKQDMGTEKLPGYLLALGCAVLPWADLAPVLLYVWPFVGVAALMTDRQKLPGIRHLLDPLVIFFFLFYLLQLWAWIRLPGDPNTIFSLEQKASLLLMPFLLSLLLQAVPGVWLYGVRGFLAGMTAACLYCLSHAVVAYIQLANHSVFFYSAYSSAVASNPIYLSVYVLAAVCALICYHRAGKLPLPRYLFAALIGLFYMTIILLSSKMLIPLGSLIILVLLFPFAKNKIQRLLIPGLMVSLVAALMFIDGPVRNRFRQIDLSSARNAMELNDFSNYEFNGLDLRLLLWRMAQEVLGENDRWLLGQGGRTYHIALNRKMEDYNLFSGNAVTKDTGYLNYNMHNQYVENAIQFGIVGIALLLGILLLCTGDALRIGSRFLLALVIIFSVSFLSESILETQSGILLFTIFIYGEWKQSKLAKA
jgi:hypothetical protein